PFRSARQKLGIKPYQPKGAKSGGWVWGLLDHSPKKGDGQDHPQPPHPAHQMPSETQMPSNKRASNSSGACDDSHQVPPRCQMPSNERASDRARASDTGDKTPSHWNPAGEFPDLPDF